VNPAASLSIFVCLALIVAAGVLAFTWLKPSATPPPQEIADDPLLVRGREVFLDRCASCHGAKGLGDGPTAKGLPGPPVGNLTDAEWKHGDAPEKVLAVIKVGVKDSQMPGWGNLIRPGDIKASAAYVYYLGGRPVPEILRAD
jgi:cytochrome c oxidase cbb3-type subunit 3